MRTRIISCEFFKALLYISRLKGFVVVKVFLENAEESVDSSRTGTRGMVL